MPIKTIMIIIKHFTSSIIKDFYEGASRSSKPTRAQLPHLLLHACWTLKGYFAKIISVIIISVIIISVINIRVINISVILITDFQDQREKLQLREAAHYRYLTGGGSTVCEGRFVLETSMSLMSTSMSTALTSTSGIVSCRTSNLCAPVAQLVIFVHQGRW